MEYKVEDLSAVKKKIQVTVPTPDINKAIDAALAEYTRSARLPGFRKGKVPPGLIESRYRREVYSEAMTSTVDNSISRIFEELKIKPASKVELDHEDPERNKPFKFTIEFEVFPTFELPEYKGLAVEEYKAEVQEQEIEDTLSRIRESLAEIVPVEEARSPADGEVVYVDFSAFENGEPVKSMTASNYQIILGKEEAVAELEELIKTLKPGESGEKEITFSEEMVNKDIAGKTLLLKVSLQGIAQRKVPEISEELAQRLGAGTVEKMRSSIADSYQINRKNEAKEAAQDKLLQQLLDAVDYPLPESLVEHHANVVVDEIKYRNSRAKGGAAAEEVSDELKAQARKDAESYVKGQIMLLSIADNEKLDVTPEEVERRLENLAQRSGMEAKALKQYYIEQNLIYSLRDRMLTEKALDVIYNAAVVTEIDASAADAAGAPKKATPKKKAATEKTPAAEKKPPAAKKTATAEPSAEEKPKKTRAASKTKNADDE